MTHSIFVFPNKPTSWHRNFSYMVFYHDVLNIGFMPYFGSRDGISQFAIQLLLYSSTPQNVSYNSDMISRNALLPFRGISCSSYHNVMMTFPSLFKLATATADMAKRTAVAIRKFFTKKQKTRITNADYWNLAMRTGRICKDDYIIID